MLPIPFQQSLLVLLVLLSGKFLLALSQEASDERTCLLSSLATYESFNRFLHHRIIVMLIIKHVVGSIAISAFFCNLRSGINRAIGSVDLPGLDLDVLMGPFKVRPPASRLLYIWVE